MGNKILSDFNEILESHNCYIKEYSQYMACKTDKQDGNLMQLHLTKKGKLNVDIKRSIWNKIAKDYKNLLRTQFKAHMALNGYIRLSNVDNLGILTALLITALD